MIAATPIDASVPFGSRAYLTLLVLLVLARGLDFLSTWVATPRLVLEGNPIARRLGWKWGGLVNGILCVAFAFLPIAAVIVSTTSLLVAARNFQSAWLMRTLGEEHYREWYVNRLREVRWPVYAGCLAGQTLLVAGLGLALAWFCEEAWVPFAIGIGLIGYAVAVVLYSGLSAWKIRKAGGPIPRFSPGSDEEGRFRRVSGSIGI